MPLSEQVLDIVPLVGSDIKNPTIELDPIDGSVAINKVPIKAKPISEALSCAGTFRPDRTTTWTRIGPIPQLVPNVQVDLTR